jgi:hypothetical protein
VPDMQAVLDSRSLAINFNHDRQVTVELPNDVVGGEHFLFVRHPNGDESNMVPFSIRPLVLSLEQGGNATDVFIAGDPVSIMGRSFDPEAVVFLDDEPLEATWISANQIDVAVPTVQGDDAGGTIRIRVQNTDALASDDFTAMRLPSRDSGFRPSRHGYAFANPSGGSPSWGTLRETFGISRAGLAARMARYPVLLPAFFLFYRWFLGNNGQCTGMATTSLQHYHQNRPDLFDAEPSLTDNLLRDLTVAQGRVISRQLVVHYADQGREGINRVERTIREIEASFDDRLAEANARVLCFIPSGNVWNIIKKEEIRQAFFRSHCVVPTRIVYPNRERSLDGARLYVYENNRPGNEEVRIDLFEEGGELHFSTSYTSSFKGQQLHFSTSEGFTLGTATLQQQLIDDVSLPFSGTVGEVTLMKFALDLVLSPARITIESHDGKVLGFKDGQMHSDPELGYVSPWMENYLLTRSDVEVKHRIIVGEAEGTYTYVTVHPHGRSVTIRDTSCSSRTRDKVILDQEYNNVELEVSEQKAVDLHVGDERPDGSVRYFNVRCSLEQGEKTRLTLGEALDGIEIQTPNRDLPVHVELAVFIDDQLEVERTLDHVVPANQVLTFPAGLWGDLKQFHAITK